MEIIGNHGRKWLWDVVFNGEDILEGLETELPDIMCNLSPAQGRESRLWVRYGNYLCSAAFQSCSVAQRLRMWSSEA